MNDTTAHTTVVDRLLAAIRAGDLAAADHLYTPGTTLDAVVPGWRFALQGGGRPRCSPRWVPR